MFSVRQKQPATLDGTVVATLETESYTTPQVPLDVSSALLIGDENTSVGVESVDRVDKLTHVIDRASGKTAAGCTPPSISPDFHWVVLEMP